MSPGPTRKTVAGSRYLDIQNLARRTRRPTEELLQLYALEGYLDRLSRSSQRDRFVLKGGVLLAAYDSRRPTRDVDLAGVHLANDAEEIAARVCEVAATELDDGLLFDFSRPRTEIIRDEDVYSGLRVGLVAQLATARLSFHVDVNVGDPVWPPPVAVDLPRLLGGVVVTIGYPLTMVHAEKLVTALERGTANTRWRDFVDVAALAASRPIDAAELRGSPTEVAEFRSTPLLPSARS